MAKGKVPFAEMHQIFKQAAKECKALADQHPKGERFVPYITCMKTKVHQLYEQKVASLRA